MEVPGSDVFDDRDGGCAALLATITSLPGCAREERGPILSGGREVKSWIADLHNPKPQVRRQAVLKLGNAGDSDPAIAEGLAEALQGVDPIYGREKWTSLISIVREGKEPQGHARKRLMQAA